MAQSNNIDGLGALNRSGPSNTSYSNPAAGLKLPQAAHINENDHTSLSEDAHDEPVHQVASAGAPSPTLGVPGVSGNVLSPTNNAMGPAGMVGGGTIVSGSSPHFSYA